MLTKEINSKILIAQKNEITEHIIYKRLARKIKLLEQKEILEKISQEELRHYESFKNITGQEVRPDRFKIFIYVFIARVFGLNFGLRLMEGGEDLAQGVYDRLRQVSAEVEAIIADERKHESQLLDLINEEGLKYASSMVLGLNDALVELTGALVGFTLALQNTRLVAIVGLITGIAASMSMAASEYLSTKHEESDKDPLKASIYTGFAYVGTVLFLVFPYFLFKNMFFCLSLVIIDALLVILIFTFYISVAKELSFRKKFQEMALLSLSIAAINFLIGLIIRRVFGIDI